MYNSIYSSGFASPPTPCKEMHFCAKTPARPRACTLVRPPVMVYGNIDFVNACYLSHNNFINGVASFKLVEVVNKKKRPRIKHTEQINRFDVNILSYRVLTSLRESNMLFSIDSPWRGLRGIELPGRREFVKRVFGSLQDSPEVPMGLVSFLRACPPSGKHAPHIV